MAEENTKKAHTFFLPAERDTKEAIRTSADLVVGADFIYSVLNTIPGPAVVLNDKRQLIAANETLLGLIGAETLEDTLGCRPGEVLRCEIAETAPASCGTGLACKYCGLVNTVLRSMRSGKRESGECRIMNKDGNPLDLEVVATSSKISDVPIVFVGMRDISAEKRRDVLEKTFLHDIMNTAGGIRGILEVFSKDDQGRSRTEFRQTMLELSEALVGEIQSHRKLLDAEQGTLSLHQSAVRTNTLLDGLRMLYQAHPVAHGKRVRIKEQCALTIATDISLLRRVLGNLLKNAIEAIKEGETVDIGVRDMGEDVEFFVHNPGYIPEKIQMQLFRRSFSTKGAGRGIGTYSLKLFGERYLGGIVDFTSTEEEGTTFRFRLPKHTDKIDQLEQVEKDAHKSLAGLSLLVAEDNGVNQKVVRLLLESQGAKVRCVSNGKEALEAWRAGAFDAILMDITMPEMDGVEATKAIRQVEEKEKRAAKIPIIALTGHTAHENAGYFDAGMNDILEKPIDLALVQESLLKLCR